MDALKTLETSLNGLLGLPPHIVREHLGSVAPLLSREATIRLIDAVLADDAALAVIAARSYTQSFGQYSQSFAQNWLRLNRQTRYDFSTWLI